MEDPVSDTVIIGLGKVGLAFVHLARKNSVKISAIGARDIEKASRLIKSEFPGESIRIVEPSVAAGMGELVILAVNEDSISPLCKELSETKSFQKGATVIHCSGSLTSDELESARELCDCEVASFHPLQSFASIENVLKRVEKTWVFFEGSPKGVEIGSQFFTKIGIKSQKISKNHKMMYHISASILSNFLVTLVDAGLEISGQAGLDKQLAWDAMSNLIENTLDNISKGGTQRALTGPIQRGDIATVRAHFEEICKKKPEFIDFYKVLGKYTVKLALKTSGIDNNKADEFLTLLD